MSEWHEAVKRITQKLKTEFPKLPEGKGSFSFIEGTINEAIKQCKNNKNLIPYSIAQDEDIQESDDKRLILSFEFFNEDESNFKSINEAKASAIIEKFKQITETTLEKVRSLIRDEIKRNNCSVNYKSFFNKLSPDIEKIYELGFSGNDGRIFFLWDESAYFYIIAILTKHINLHSE